MFKKWLAVMVCLFLLASFTLSGLSVSAGPGDTVGYSLSVTDGGVGDTVTVSLSITENSRFTNALIYIHYDSSAVTYVADSLGTGSASPKTGTMVDALDYPANNYVKSVYVTAGIVTKQGVLMTFDFDVISDKPAAFSISFEECQGEAEDGTMFDVKYAISGCVLNNDGSVSTPSAGPVVGQVTTTSTSQEATTAGTMVTMPTMVVVDQDNNLVDVPVTSTTDDKGNVQTYPVTVVTNAQGTTVTLPVHIVTDSQGAVQTMIPVAESTNAQGENVTIPVMVVTDNNGEVQTVPVATETNAEGSLVTRPLTTTTRDNAQDDEGNSNLILYIVIVAICFVVAVIVAIVATKIKRKK